MYRRHRDPLLDLGNCKAIALVAKTDGYRLLTHYLPLIVVDLAIFVFISLVYEFQDMRDDGCFNLFTFNKRYTNPSATHS